ncbi:MAG TPA: hypothetical protein EYP79_02565 [Campylobacterales bacterium]|nr:hypothetical protein [Campylobacterales bacterium]
MVLLGAGLIGCEFANDLAQRGYRVDMIDLAPLPLGRLVPPEIGRAMQEALAALGVDWHLATSVATVDRNGDDGLTVTLDNGYTKEEMKMVNETKKIMHKDIEVSATCVRVPVLRGHSEALSIWFEKDITAEAAREALYNGKNIEVIDNPQNSEYPMPITVVDKDETFVGRIRKDIYKDNILHMWVVADNLRVGAATNAVRIALKWLEMEDI